MTIINKEEIIFLTPEGKINYEKELNNLVKVLKPKATRELAAARAQGDVTDNDDYTNAKIEIDRILKRIREINFILARCKILEKNEPSNEVVIGSKVKLEIIEGLDKKIKAITVVNSLEADPFKEFISEKSPLVKAILGKKVNDEITVYGVENPYKVRILEIL
jgi:transcription elongation factor GreA